MGLARCGYMTAYVAQELYAHGFILYYYNSKNHGEVDFVIEDKNGEVILLEVKSGKVYPRHRALNNIMEIKKYALKKAYVLGPSNIEKREEIIYLPIYLTAFFTNEN